jgi:enoyl-CoA hydratase
MNINSYECIKAEIKNELFYLTLSRPQKLNALNRQVLSELKDFLTSILESNDVNAKGMIFTGEGEKAFIAGADIAEMSCMNVTEAYEFGKLGQEVTLLLEQMPFPVIAAVNGFALGGGCELAMSCDFILATSNAVFGQPEVKLGLIPGFGGTQRLENLIGRQPAKEIIFSGRNVKIDEAVSLGLVFQVLANKDELIKGAEDLLASFNVNSPNAVRIAKKVMNEGNDLSIPQGLQKELEQFSAIFSSSDMKEGTIAFVEKRAAKFLGK